MSIIQPDWWEVTKAGVGTNRYAYAGGDPVNGIDPSGNQALPTNEPSIWERFIKWWSPTSPGTSVSAPANVNSAPSSNSPSMGSILGRIAAVAAPIEASRELEELNNEGNKLYRGLTISDVDTLFGSGTIRPTDPTANISPEQHALGIKPSQYISVTTRKEVAEKYATDRRQGSSGYVVELDGQKLLFSGGLVFHSGFPTYSRKAQTFVLKDSEILYLGSIPFGAISDIYLAPSNGFIYYDPSRR